MAKQDDYTRYTIRIPTPLYERVKAAAGEKSVNAEIVEVLEREYPAQDPAKEAFIELWEHLKAMSRKERLEFLEQAKRTAEEKHGPLGPASVGIYEIVLQGIEETEEEARKIAREIMEREGD